MRPIEYNTDLVKQSYNYKACMQGDDLKIKLNIYNNSLKYDLTGATAKLNWAKPDGTPKEKENDITIENNTISCVLNEEYTDVHGKAKFEFEITKDGKITTFPLQLIIAEKVFQSEVVNNKIVELLNLVKIDDAIDDFMDGIKKEITSMSSEIDENVNLLNARMDTFTKLAEGSTTGDAEIADGRVGADGTIYENIGSAIREQTGELNNDLVCLKKKFSKTEACDVNSLERINGKLITDSNGQNDISAGIIYIIEIENGSYIQITSGLGGVYLNYPAFIFLDENDSVLGKYVSTDRTYSVREKIPSGTTKIKVNHVSTTGISLSISIESLINVRGEINNLNNEFNSLKQFLDNTKYVIDDIDYSSTEVNKAISQNGKISAQTGLTLYEYQLNGEQKLHIETGLGGVYTIYPYFVFTDEEENVLFYVNGNSQLHNNSIDVPQGAKKLYVNRHYNFELKVQRLKLTTLDEISKRIDSIDNRVKHPTISIPNVIYARKGEELSFYWDNAIVHDANFDYKNWNVKLTLTKNGTSIYPSETYGFTMLPNGFIYKPIDTNDINLTVNIVDIYSNEIIESKSTVLRSIDSTLKNNTDINVLMIGDSFVDGFGVARHTLNFLSDVYRNVNFLGTQNIEDNNDISYVSPINQHDEGYGGRWYSWFYTDKNGPFYSDGTTVDFKGYVQNKIGGERVDVFVMCAGINDIAWFNINSPTDYQKMRATTSDIKSIAEAVHNYDSNIKILLQLLPIFGGKDYYMPTVSKNTADMYRYNSELFNNWILEDFKDVNYVTIMATNTNWNRDYSLIHREIKPCKFDNSIVLEAHGDLHPNTIGAKYIADTIVNTICGVF